MNTQNLQHQIVAYLLGTADAQTQQEIGAYIELGGEESQQRAQEARASLRSLMQLLEPMQPDRASRTALFDRVNGVVEPRTMTYAGDDAHVSGIDSRRKFILPASCAAAIALVVVSVVALFSIRHSVLSQRHEHVAEGARILDDANARGATRDPSDIATMMQAYFDLVPLRSRSPSAHSSSRLLVSRQHELCFVFAPALITPESSGMYDLRLTFGEDEPVLAGQFSVDSKGWSLFPIHVPQESDFAVARASVVRSETAGETKQLEELLVGDFPQ